MVFFATWLSETSDLKAELTGLNAYVTEAASKHLPAADRGRRDRDRAVGRGR